MTSQHPHSPLTSLRQVAAAWKPILDNALPSLSGSFTSLQQESLEAGHSTALAAHNGFPPAGYEAQIHAVKTLLQSVDACFTSSSQRTWLISGAADAELALKLQEATSALQQGYLLLANAETANLKPNAESPASLLLAQLLHLTIKAAVRILESMPEANLGGSAMEEKVIRHLYFLLSSQSGNLHVQSVLKDWCAHPPLLVGRPLTTEFLTSIFPPAVLEVTPPKPVNALKPGTRLAKLHVHRGEFRSVSLVKGALPMGVSLDSTSGEVAVAAGHSTPLLPGLFTGIVLEAETSLGKTTLPLLLELLPASTLTYDVISPTSLDQLIHVRELASPRSGGALVAQAQLLSGNLPPGCALNSTSGNVEVVRPASLTAGTSTFSLQCTDLHGAIHQPEITITLLPVPGK